VKPQYRRLTPPISSTSRSSTICTSIRSHRGEGVTFNLIGAISQFGKLGVVSIPASSEAAEALYGRTVRMLDAAC